MENLFRGKRILVTGGTGSIGREIVRQLLGFGPEVVRVLSRSEHSQYEMAEEFREHGRALRFFVGDVRDAGRLRLAITDVDIVFHAAALKHVPICEYNPFEAVKTNVLGTQNLIEAAMNERVARLVAVSTDKAVSPINTMGATKLLAERLVTSANLYKGRRDIKLASVRFGNVMGSRGSVIPAMISQIQRGGPVTITHPDMTRFFMTISEAVSLVLKAARIMRGGEVYILKMPVLKIADLAEILISEMAPRFGARPSDIAVETTGLRPGERLYEELLTRDESHYMQEHDDMYELNPNTPASAVPGSSCLSSDNAKPLSKDDIILLLKRENII